MEHAADANRVLRPLIICQEYDKTVFHFNENEKLSFSFLAMEWLDEVTTHFGSSLEGRMKSFHKLIGTSQKAGVLLSEHSLEMYFPLRGLSAKENYWIHYNELMAAQSYGKKNTLLHFRNGLQFEVPFDSRTVKLQIKRCRKYIECIVAEHHLKNQNSIDFTFF